MKFKPVKQINWMEISGLLVGVFFTIAVMIFGLVLYTKLFTSGMIGVEEYKLHSTFEKALGLRPGTRVQISGVDVGQISDMEIKDNGVFLEFTIRKQFQSWITDSAQIYAIRDQNLISARVVTIEVRKGVGHILEDGDYIAAGRAQDIETVLETANELLGRVNLLIDAADSLVAMTMDTGTTVGALFGSRALYDNLNRQIVRLDDITLAGKSAIYKTSHLLDTLQNNVPGLLHKVDGLLKEVGQVTTGLSDFMESTEQTLQNADDLMTGISNMWIIRRSMPSKDSVPFMVETLW